MFQAYPKTFKQQRAPTITSNCTILMMAILALKICLVDISVMTPMPLTTL